MNFNPLRSPNMMNALKWDQPSDWVQHTPFAFFIVQALKPKLIVELGTSQQTSYSAFCTSVKNLRLGASCYAISPEIDQDFKAYHDPRYGDFSVLVNSPLADALANFTNGSIDLLHIDGQQSYETVQHNFQMWLPKMSHCGVILLHNVNEYLDDSGVWRFWGEIRTQYPSFTFLHAHGLGVAAVGEIIAEKLQPFFQADQDEADAVRHYFYGLGQAAARHAQDQLTLRQLRADLNTREAEIAALTNTVQHIQNSLSWRITRPLRWFNTRFPAVTRFSQQTRNYIQLAMSGGLRAHISNFRRQRQQIQIITKYGLFNPQWYREQYPDVAKAGIDPLIHYLTIGWKRNRNPGPDFSTLSYLAVNPDVAAAQTNPLVHYAQYGQSEKRPLYPPPPLVKPSSASLRQITQEEFERNYANPNDLVSFSANQPLQLTNQPVKLIAYYLPQFYPVPINDRSWGKGFTEWTTVTRARPAFIGHYQPRLPSDLGFYDLRLVDNLKAQAELARQHGISSFCIYRYWFNGEVVLEQPLELLYEHKEIDIEYCLCWANSIWNRRWDGRETEVLLRQQHSEEDDLRFIIDAERFFQDKRYTRIDNKPVLVLYQLDVMPNPVKTAQIWRDYCLQKGYDGLYLVVAETFLYDKHPADIGFDATVQFPPHKITAPRRTNQFNLLVDFRGVIFDYEEFANSYLGLKENGTNFLTVSPSSWDNTARRGRQALIVTNGSPQKYYNWLRSAIQQTIDRNAPNERVIFINAWNEWAEGAYLEPDRKYGYAYLNATSEALASFVTHDGDSTES